MTPADLATARREAERFLSVGHEWDGPTCIRALEIITSLLAATEPAAALPEEVKEAAIRAFRDLLSEPADLESPASLVASGMWEKGDDAAPFWSEAGLYGRVGKEAARTLLYRHRKATEALAALAAFLWRHRNCRSAEMEVLP